MQSIMRLVQSTSQSALIFRQLINVGKYIFVQLIHNTDSDELLLLVINDLKKMNVIEKEVTLLVKNELALLIQRYGGSTFDCLANVTSLFMSIEFESILKKLAFDCCDDKVNSTLPTSKRHSSQVKHTLQSNNTQEVKSYHYPKLGESLENFTDS